MMNSDDIQGNRKDKRKARFTSFAIHSIALFLILLPIWTYEVPPPGQRGVLVSFGAPDMGSGQDRPETQMEEEQVPKPPAEPEKEENVEEISEPITAQTDSKIEPPSSSSPEVVTSNDPDVPAVNKKQEEEERLRQEETRKKREDEDRRRSEEMAKVRAQEEAQKKAQEEARQKAEYEQAKKQFGQVFGQGKGDTDKPGNQGDPEGDPDANRLEGISTGSGMVGGGLHGRGVVYEPKINEKSQKTGLVVVRVCVDRSGRVVSADYTQRGSTTTDSDLVTIATDASKKFRFTDSTIDKQCGTITIDFKVR